MISLCYPLGSKRSESGAPRLRSGSFPGLLALHYRLLFRTVGSSVALLLYGAGAGGVLSFAPPLAGCTSASEKDAERFEGDDSGIAADATPKMIAPPPHDSSVTTADASSCEPGDVSGFTPEWKPPKLLHQGLCTPQQITAFKTSCIGAAATPVACAPFSAAGTEDQKCAACIKSQESDPKYGPLIARRGFVQLNIGGCIASLQGDTKGSGCGGSSQASLQCVAAACSSNCPVSNDTSFQDYQSCASLAAQAGCKAYVENARCVQQLSDEGGDVARTCLVGSSFSDGYDLIVPLFCGGLLDAGGGGD